VSYDGPPAGEDRRRRPGCQRAVWLTVPCPLASRFRAESLRAAAAAPFASPSSPGNAPMKARMLLALAVGLCPPSLLAQKKDPRARPAPSVADFEYGKDSERQKFDFWQAKSDKPTPLVLLIHGGGWMGGDKTAYGTNMIQPFLDSGISVAALNYRFI